jgi:ABC-2 type transport system ATP-binding protein
MSQAAVQFASVRRTFGRVVAVDRVDLRIEPGTFVGLIGHNGAGKSTLIRMLTGLLRPSEGKVLIAGVDVHEEPRQARLLLGAVPEQPALYEYMSAREFLNFVAEVRGGTGVDDLLESFDLLGDADRLLREYSQGMRRKTALAAALLGDPKLLVLDESLNGLDPPSAARVKALLRERVDAGCTVLLSTHVVDTVARVADRVVMLAHGNIVADEDAQALGAAGLEELFLERLNASRYSTSI